MSGDGMAVFGESLAPNGDAPIAEFGAESLLASLFVGTGSDVATRGLPPGVVIKKETNVGVLGSDAMLLEAGINCEPNSAAGGAEETDVLYKTECINTWLEAQHAKHRAAAGQMHRPTLVKRLYDTGEHDADIADIHRLYEFDALNQWFDYPLKRQKVDCDESADLLSQQQHEGPLSAAFGLDPMTSSTGAGHDPYEFSDEASSGKVHYATGNRRHSGSNKGGNGVGGGKEDQKNDILLPDEKISFQDEPLKGGGATGCSSQSGSLMNLMELPDNIFDTSDDDSTDGFNATNDDNRSSQTGSGSNNTDKMKSGWGMPGGLAADPEHAVLAQMFPTPPTNENQHSPGMGTDFGDFGGGGVVCGVNDSFSSIVEPTVTVSDYSFVYKPAIHSTFVTSTKYAPIELPSKSQPIITISSSNNNSSSNSSPTKEIIQPQSINNHTAGAATTSGPLSTPLVAATSGAGVGVGVAPTGSGVVDVKPVVGLGGLSYLPSYHGFMATTPLGCGAGGGGGGNVIKGTSQHSNYSSLDTSVGSSQSTPLRSSGGGGSAHHVMSSQDMSPANASGPRSAQQLTPRTPLSLDLQSPLSNASSYMHANLKSIDNTLTNSSLPEVNSVVVNIMLTDSLLNLFKDENFESCTICACNTNIRGSDVGLYLPDLSKEQQYPCQCGFSAVVNRRHGHDSGLFYEDEVEITGMRDERLEVRKPSLLSLYNINNKDNNNGNTATNSSSMDKSKTQQQQHQQQLNDSDVLSQDLLTLLQNQFTCVYPSLTVAQYCGERSPSGLPLRTRTAPPVNILERLDACEACYTALEVGRQAMDNCTSSKLDDQHMKKTCMHHWPYLNLVKLPSNSQETLRKLRRLLPLLEDAIQKKRTTHVWESVYRIMGPLSWKDFHLLAGRGSDESSEPQPIPSVLVGYDKEWMSLTPQSLQYWDKLMLEPYGRPRDIAYIVVCPETDYILERAKTFFSDLSQQYELCRLGRHRPIAKKLREGIIRVNRKAATSLENEPLDEWFTLLGDHPLAAKLRLYAKVCRHQLGPFLKVPGSLERRDIFIDEHKKSSASTASLNSSGTGSSLSASQQQSSSSYNSSQPRPSPAPSPGPSPAPPHTPGGDGSSERGGDGDDGKDDDARSHLNNSATEDADSDNGDSLSVVIYIVDPFTYGQEWPDLPRFAMLGLLRCYHEMLRDLPEHLRSDVHLQVIPLSSIVQYRDNAQSESLRSLALSVYTQCRRLITHSVMGRSLTGFGPAAAALDKIQKSEPGHTSRARLYSPPFVIAPTRASALTLNHRDHDASRVLFCGYCLSEDQRWLLAVCTDNRGELLETCTINIEIPNRNRRKKASARYIGLQKLWDFILGVLSSNVSPWRLVIGRFGRIGHGELIGWAGLLSRTNLKRASRQLCDMCGMCAQMSCDEPPCIHSACLVSMEMHASIVVMHDTLKLEERQSSKCPLSTPRDASVTHILVMPTSATASSQSNLAATDNQSHLYEDGFGMDGFGMGDDITLGVMNELEMEGMFEFDIPMMVDSGAHHGDPEHKYGSTTSPNHLGPGGRISPGHQRGEFGGSMSDAQDEKAENLLQQPLAIGYYVSTARTGPLPASFYSACPHKQDLCPTCFKATLHVNSPNVHTQENHTSSSANKHQLDSNATPDVLRYVLETYNTLSWLTMDPLTGDRRSSLPVHFVVLMQLYHAMNTFV